jgi:hypothetical protein
MTGSSGVPENPVLEGKLCSSKVPENLVLDYVPRWSNIPITNRNSVRNRRSTKGIGNDRFFKSP